MKLTEEEKVNLEDDLRLALVINGRRQFWFPDTPANAARKHGHLVLATQGIVKVECLNRMCRVIVLEN